MSERMVGGDGWCIAWFSTCSRDQTMFIADVAAWRIDDVHCVVRRAEPMYLDGGWLHGFSPDAVVLHTWRPTTVEDHLRQTERAKCMFAKSRGTTGEIKVSDSSFIVSGAPGTRSSSEEGSDE